MISLRKLIPSDAENMLAWMNDDKVSQNLNISNENKNINSILKFIDFAQCLDQNAHFAITNDNNEYCGTVSLKNINLKDKHAEFAIVIPSKFNGKGIGNKAIKLIIEYAKNNLALHKIYLNVYENNTIAIHVYEKNGFKQKGVYEDHILKDGQYQTLLYFEKIL